MVTAVQVKMRRDTAANIAVNTGAQGEVWFDTTNNRLVANDGSKAGGYPHAQLADVPIGYFRNLLLGNAAGPQSFTAPSTPNNQVKIKADALSLQNSSGWQVALSSVSVTADVTTSGANGLDTGSVVANTWYSAWVIYNGTTIAALLSLSATAPTMPSGYTYKARVGWFLTDGSSHFMRILQQGRNAQYVVTSGSNTAELPLIASGSIGSVSAPTWVGTAVAGFVPPTASEISLAALISSSGGTNVLMAAPNNAYGAYNSGTNPPPFVTTFITGGNGGAMGRLGLEGADIYCACNGGGYLRCVGWEDNL
jgi:hypothetical protein